MNVPVHSRKRRLAIVATLASIVPIVGCAMPSKRSQADPIEFEGRVATTQSAVSADQNGQLVGYKLGKGKGKKSPPRVAMAVLLDDLDQGLDTEPEFITPPRPSRELPRMAEEQSTDGDVMELPPPAGRPQADPLPGLNHPKTEPLQAPGPEESVEPADDPSETFPPESPRRDDTEWQDASPEQQPSTNWQPTPDRLTSPGQPAAMTDSAVRTSVRSAADAPVNFRDLSEDEMLRIALQSSPVLRPLGVRVLDNPAAASTIYDPAIDANDPFFGPRAALAEFDTRLNASVNAQNNDRVFNNVTLGGQVSELTQDFVTANAGVSRRTTSGAILQLDAQHLYDNNNRSANRFRNYYETVWQAGIRQPLLRGAGRRFNLIAGPGAQPGLNFSRGILLARLNNQITDAEFEITVRDYVADLYSTYWLLQQNYLEYDAAVAAANVAHQTWQTVLARRDANVAGGEASKEAQSRADYYRYLRQVQVSLGGSGSNTGLYETQRRLRHLMGLPIVQDQLLRPIDTPPMAPFQFDGDDLLSRGLASRIEIRRQQLRVQNEQLRLVAAKNFLLPQLDGVGRYRLRGFGDDLTGNSRSRFASAYEDFFNFDHQEWEFGVEMSQTVGRRQARAAVRQAYLKVHRERSILEQSQRDLRQEISSAEAEVQSAWTTLQTTQLQVTAAQDRLESSMALYEAGRLQIEFLLDAQADLLQAELQSAADQSRYALSLVGIGEATGTLLGDVGIIIQTSDCNVSTAVKL